MEVHHHPHVEKKRFREYFFEFLMIFLAVTLGFFAEGLREHLSDNKVREGYIQSLTEDLIADTVKMADIIHFDDAKIAALTTMNSCYDSVTRNWKETNCIGLLIKYSKVNRPFLRNDRTVIQLGNAGGFRLLEKEDADSILTYDRQYRALHDFESTVYQEAQDNVRNTLNELVDFRIASPLQEVSGSMGNDTGPSVPNGSLLFSNSPGLLNKWFNQLELYLRVMKAQRSLLGQLQARASRLIYFYTDKYHLR